MRKNTKLFDLSSYEDTAVTTFGAGKHGFRLGPTLSEEELLDFETSHSVSLPGDYRAFLKYIGNGGAGPGYGLRPLEAGRRDSNVSRPFAFTERFGWGGEGVPYDEDDNPAFRKGILYLAHHGCGIESFLIVNGPCRGQVWIDDVCNDSGVFPEAGSFYFWYNAWINEALMNLFASRLGKPID